MEYIIDTHVFLWYITGDKNLEAKSKDIISNLNNSIFLSVASIWECIIKQKLGKIKLPDNVAEYLILKRIEHEVESLPINEKTMNQLAKLPSIHKDPFDRIIICQALEMNCKIITKDSIMKQYPFPIF